MAAPVTAADGLSPRAAAGGYAGIVSRGIALAIDSAIVQAGLLLAAALFALVGALVGGVHLGSIGQAAVAVGWIVVTAAYFVICWAAAGQTLGMQWMHLAVRAADGRPPSLSRSCIRVVWLGLCILPFFAGFVTVFFDDRRRGLHDIVAGTVVVHVDEPVDVPGAPGTPTPPAPWP